MIQLRILGSLGSPLSVTLPLREWLFSQLRGHVRSFTQRDLQASKLGYLVTLHRSMACSSSSLIVLEGRGCLGLVPLKRLSSVMGFHLILEWHQLSIACKTTLHSLISFAASASQIFPIHCTISICQPAGKGTSCCVRTFRRVAVDSWLLCAVRIFFRPFWRCVNLILDHI